MANSTATGDQATSVNANAGRSAPVDGGNELAKGLGGIASPVNQLSSSQLLTLTWAVLLVLMANIVVGTIMIWRSHEVWIWARVVFSLGVTAALLILDCMLIYRMGKIGMED